MSSRELQLLSRIIRTSCLHDVLGWGINSSDFVTGEARAMFDHMVAYNQANRGSIIGPEAAKHAYPTFQLCDDPGMHTEALCREVRNYRLMIEGGKKLADVQNLMSVDPLKAIAMLSGHAADLQALTSSRNTDVRSRDAFARIMHKYELRKSGYSFSVLSWPWEPIQAVTGGIQPDDYIVYYGRPKSMKSWVLAYKIAWAFNHHKRVVIYTKEMTADNIFQRTLACIAQVAYDGLRLGNMQPHEEYAVYTVIRMVEQGQMDNLIVLSGQDVSEGGDTVPWLSAKVQQYQPHLVAIDGMYLMSDVKNSRRDNDRVRNISRDLRQMNLSLGVPLITTLQANRDAAGHNQANLDEIAFSDAIGQDATHIFRVINEKNQPTIALVTGGGREFSLNGWRIWAMPAQNFTYHGPITEKEIEQAKEKDVGDQGQEAQRPAAHRSSAPAASAGMRQPDPMRSIGPRMDAYLNE